MTWTKLPPLNALKAFTVLAETRSYTAAGQQLNVTHAAVSQQIKLLEAHLNISLVTRKGRLIHLTEDGQTLSLELAKGFQAFHRGIAAIERTQSSLPIQVSTSPAFASSWLMPRLAKFQKKHPNITLMLNPTSEVVDVHPGGVDVAIRYSEVENLSETDDVLLISDMVVVGTPSLLANRSSLTPRDMLDLPWLQELGTNEAANWMALQGVTLHHTMSIHHMPGNLIMEAVRRGDGLTYTLREFVKTDIKNGELIELHRMPAFGAFHLVLPSGVLRSSVKTFVTWLRSQTAGSTSAAKTP